MIRLLFLCPFSLGYARPAAHLLLMCSPEGFGLPAIDTSSLSDLHGSHLGEKRNRYSYASQIFIACLSCLSTALVRTFRINIGLEDKATGIRILITDLWFLESHQMVHNADDAKRSLA